MLVRAAEARDARGIAHVHIASWRETYSELMDLDKAGEHIDVDARTRTWSERIPLVGAEGFRVWVAETSGRIVGLAFTQPTEDDDLNPLEVAELTSLYVHPDHIGAGVGKTLLDRAVAGMRNQGFLQASLWVLEENASAIHFYRREGWKPDGARDACYRVVGAPAIRFRLPL